VNDSSRAVHTNQSTEFVFGREFADMAEFKLLWFDYVNWYNNIRIHGSLDYLTPQQWHDLSWKIYFREYIYNGTINVDLDLYDS